MFVATVNYGAISAITGVFVVVLTVGGAVLKRRQTKQRTKREHLEAEMTAEHQADAKVLARLAEHDAEIRVLKTALKGEEASWSNPHPPPGLIEKVDNITQMLGDVAATVKRIERNGNGH